MCFRATSFCSQITGMPAFFRAASCSSVGPFHRPMYALMPMALYFSALEGDWSQTRSGKKLGSLSGPVFHWAAAGAGAVVGAGPAALDACIVAPATTTRTASAISIVSFMVLLLSVGTPYHGRRAAAIT